MFLILMIKKKSLVTLRVGRNRKVCNESRGFLSLPVRDGEWFNLFIQVPMQHVFVAGDPQGFGHGVCVKGRVQSHQSSMNPFTLKIVCKLLKSTTCRDKGHWKPKSGGSIKNTCMVFFFMFFCILSAEVPPKQQGYHYFCLIETSVNGIWL